MKFRALHQPAGMGACVGLALAAALCAMSLPAQVQLPDVSNDYTIQTVQLPDDTAWTFNFWINDSGMGVLGYWAVDSVDCGDGAVLENGQWKRLHAPMPDGTISAHTSPGPPNSSGRVPVCYNVYTDTLVGKCICHKAIYHKGTYTPFGDQGYPTFEGWNWCLSVGMNDHGLITCYAWVMENPNIPYHGLLVNESLSLFQFVDPPDSQYTWVAGLNNAETMVGQYLNGNDWLWHGFVTERGETFRDLDVPGAQNPTIPYCVNNNGEICGSWWSSGWNGFILRKGMFSRFNVPGSSWSFLDSITDNGKLAGLYGDANGNQYCYIATPKAGQ